MMLPGSKIGLQEGGRGSSSMVCPLTGPLLAVVFLKGQFWGPSFLSSIYINDLDLSLSSKVSKFADDTKLGINAANPESVRALQRDLAAIGEWSTVWQMPFNLEKCHVLHVGAANQEENYSLLGSEITSVDQETDLGVVITADLKSLHNVYLLSKRRKRSWAT